MNNLILHISDLHVSDQSGELGYANRNTHLTLDVENNNSYIKQFTEKIKTLERKDLYLIITGDITNIGEANEFEVAGNIIKLMMDELVINKDQILLIPGDHDVHRDSVKDGIRKGFIQREQQKLKFENFAKLYNDVKGVNFDSEKLIFDHMVIGDILLLAVNSNFNVKQNGGHGFLPTVEFEQELTGFRVLYPDHEFILCLHHNLEGEHEDTKFGQWDEKNRRNLSLILERQRVKCIFNGNEHTPNSKQLSDSEGIILSDSGPFSSKEKPSASFKIYEIETSGGNLILDNIVYDLRTKNSTREGNFGGWGKCNYEDIKKIEVENIVLRKAPDEQPTEIDNLPESSESQEIISAHDDDAFINGLNETSEVEAEKKIYKNKILQDKLYEIVKTKKLFHQGHFHWSETSRAHNWIDIARLLENIEDLYFVQNTVIDVLEKMNLIEGADLIIGLGYEGNMIASKASIKYGLPYTYLPYSYRWLDHNKFENELPYENDDKKYKKVILITDVVNDGRTIRKLVGKENREKKFFDNVDEIIVVSLFYTGQQTLNNNILNFNRLPDELKEGDEEVNNIEFYTVQQLKIEKCPYGEDYKTECFILRDNLHCVHKFYTEE